MNCEICFEEIKDKIITCPYCNKSLCLECAKSWLLQETIAYSCFNQNCKKPWTFNFIFNNFPIEFINNELKENYAQICFELDKQQHIQQFINNYNTIYKIYIIIKDIIDNFINNSFTEKDIEFINKNYNIIMNKIIYYDDPTYELKQCYKKYKKELNDILDKKLNNINYNEFIEYKTLYLHDGEFYNIIFKNSKYYMDNSYDIHFDNLDNYAVYKHNIKSLTIEDNKYIRNIIKKIYNFKYDVLYLYRPYDCFINCFISYYLNYITENNNIYNLICDIKRDNLYELTKYNRIKYVLDNNINRLNKIINYEDNKNNKLIKKTCKCLNEECLGYLYKYDKELICDTCNKIYCVKCRKEINPEYIEYIENDKIKTKKNEKYNEKDKHKCNKEDIETIKLLTDNVKNCPKCEVPIFKTDGCDHMWCPECHTMFNWSNLKITKTTTNPLYFEWLRSQGITPERYNHPDAQPLINECERQLNFNECIKIISSYDFKNKEKLINFVSNLELKTKPLNDGKLNMNRIKYVFKLIDENKYKKFITTQYLSKFFIDCYNNIIINTIFMISNLFHQINNDIKQYNNNKINQKYDKLIKIIKINEDNYINQIKEIINIHNNSINELNKIYPSIVIENIDIETFNTIKNNIKLKKQNKNSDSINNEIIKSEEDNIRYINSPLNDLTYEQLNDCIFIYKLFYQYNIMNSGYLSKKHYLQLYFMNVEILESNKEFYNILFSKETKKLFLFTNLTTYINSLTNRRKIKELMKLFNIQSYKKDLNKINKSTLYVLTELLLQFHRYVNKDKTNLKKYLNTYNLLIKILNDDNYKNNLKYYIERCEDENITIYSLYMNIRRTYKKHKTELINEFNKINFNYEKLNNILFNIHYEDKLYMMLYEEKIYKILNELNK